MAADLVHIYSTFEKSKFKKRNIHWNFICKKTFKCVCSMEQCYQSAPVHLSSSSYRGEATAFWGLRPTKYGSFLHFWYLFFSLSFSPPLVSECSSRSSCLPPMLLPQLRPSLLISFRGREGGERGGGGGRKRTDEKESRVKKKNAISLKILRQQLVLNLRMWSLTLTAAPLTLNFTANTSVSTEC